MSSWAILPAIPGQIATDVIRFFSLSDFSSFVHTGHLEVRYSPSGGTDTGSGSHQVGDFTVLLLDILDLGANIWEERLAVLPGSGRIAFRFHIPPSNEGFPTFSGNFKIDSLSAGPGGPACNLPPMPLAGQTATWTLSGSPYAVCEPLTIPAGGTVIVEPGVQVVFDANEKIVVEGTLQIQGADGQPSSFIAPNLSTMISVQGGTVNAHFVAFRGQVRLWSGATVELFDCIFGSDGFVWVQEIQTVVPWIRLQRCTFTNSLMALSDAFAILEDNTFSNSDASILRGFADLRGTNTVTGRKMEILLERAIQTRFIDGVHASGVPDAAGLALRGNFLLGPTNVLQGNLYSIEIVGGLDPQSVIPLTGNTINAIDARNGNAPAFTRWPDFGIPYRLTEGTPLGGGFLTIDPGVTVEAGDPTAGLVLGIGQAPIVMGLPDAPITFRAAAPGGEWTGLIFDRTIGGQHVEYLSVNDGRIGVENTGSLLSVSNSVFENNQVGVNTNSFGNSFFDGARFIHNGTGLELTVQGHANLNSLLNPNSFEGNGIGMNVASNNDARNCWWNDPTGPIVAGNPGGQGDSIFGANTLFNPFLTSPPNFADVPPVVRLVDPGYHWTSTAPMVDSFFDNDDKYIIRWDAIGPDIDHFRIEFSGDGVSPSQFSVIADNLPANQRSYEWTAPSSLPFALVGFQFLRVVGVDASGQEGFDQTPITVPIGDITGQLTITTNLTGQTFFAGQDIPDMNWTGMLGGVLGTSVPLIVFENEGRVISGLTVAGGGSFFVQFPNISTDRARLAIQVRGNSNRVIYFYADGYFSIRHDPRFGFVPPTIDFIGPITGSAFSGGTVVPITWTASATEGIHSFDILASYNDGRTWHPIVRDLPPSARSYDWLLPPSSGIPDLRLRVVVRDRRFQNSAAGDDRLFSITPDSILPGDFDGDGDVDIDDFNQFANCFTGPGGGPVAPGCGVGDLDADGDIDCDDWTLFVQAWTGVGSPPSLPQCETPIPTVSDWGLVAMALLMLTAGTLVCVNRKLGGEVA